MTTEALQTVWPLVTLPSLKLDKARLTHSFAPHSTSSLWHLDEHSSSNCSYGHTQDITSPDMSRTLIFPGLPL